jgi:hypothetical protein
MDRPPSSSPSSRARPHIGAAEIVGDGAAAGLIGASAVALWFLAVDAALREPLFTPSLVASALFEGTRATLEQRVDLSMVAAFTALHSLAFIAFGILVSWVVSRFSRTPDLPLIAIFLFLLLEGGFVAATKLLVPEVAEVIGHGFIVAGNVFAAVGMGVYLRDWQRHPEDLAAATPR